MYYEEEEIEELEKPYGPCPVCGSKRVAYRDEDEENDDRPDVICLDCFHEYEL
jgi:hypothetical protein